MCIKLKLKARIKYKDVLLKTSLASRDDGPRGEVFMIRNKIPHKSGGRPYMSKKEPS